MQRLRQLVYTARRLGVRGSPGSDAAGDEKGTRLDFAAAPATV